jgi:segregation and condensation protein B
MNISEKLQILEALLFAAPEPLSQTRVNLVFQNDAPKLDDAIKKLTAHYKKNKRSYIIQSIAGGYQITTLPKYDKWIKRMFDKSGKITLSTAAIETLAIVAYKQPINRFNVESIRGVDCSGVIKTLLSKNLIKIKGRDDSPGRPLLYSTTNDFLENFGLNRISDLPKIKEIAELTDQEMLEKMKLDSLKFNQSEDPIDISIDNNSTSNLLPSQNN